MSIKAVSQSICTAAGLCVVVFAYGPAATGLPVQIGQGVSTSGRTATQAGNVNHRGSAGTSVSGGKVPSGHGGAAKPSSGAGTNRAVEANSGGSTAKGQFGKTRSGAGQKFGIPANQQSNVNQLKSDATALKGGSTVTQEQKDALKNDINGMAKSATKPDQQLVSNLTNDLSQSMADGKVTQRENAKLMKDVDAVINSAGLTTQQVNQAILDAKSILTASGVSKAEVQKVASDLQAIANQARANASTVKESKTNTPRAFGRLKR